MVPFYNWFHKGRVKKKLWFSNFLENLVIFILFFLLHKVGKVGCPSPIGNFLFDMIPILTLFLIHTQFRAEESSVAFLSHSLCWYLNLQSKTIILKTSKYFLNIIFTHLIRNWPNIVWFFKNAVCVIIIWSTSHVFFR